MQINANNSLKQGIGSTNEGLATQSHSIPLRHSECPDRLYWLDFFRGFALIIVLLDHMDGWVGDPVFRNWTLVGLGFSDAAEGFVFLSGFTFGWVYSLRMADQGFLYCQWKAIWRAVQIFVGYLLSVAAILVLTWLLKDTSYDLSRVTSLTAIANLWETFLACCLLRYQPFALAILCLYVVILPLMPTILALARWSVFVAMVPSVVLYVAVQWNPNINLPEENGDWFFNPAAWQLIMVLGLAFGVYFRRHKKPPKKRLVVLVSGLLVVGLAMVIKKAEVLSGTAMELPPVWWQLETSNLHCLLDKTRLGPLRLIHFTALAFLVAGIVPRKVAFYKRQPLRAIRNCGRVPLRTYCIGTVLVYLSAAISPSFGSSKLLTLIIGFDLVCVQCLLATLMVNRPQKRQHRILG